MNRMFAAGIAAGTLIALSTSASASVSWSYFAGGDAAFNELTLNGSLERAATEGRIGNNGPSGTWELALWEQGGVGTPKDQAQFVWGNGQATSFSVVYDGISTVTYTVGQTTVSWNALAGGFTDIFIRTRSAADSSVLLSNLDFVGSGLNIGDLSSTGNGDVNYIRISNAGGDFGAFTITGLSTFDWGVQPSNSALAYQFKFSNVIPAPGAIAVLGLAGLVGRRRRA